MSMYFVQSYRILCVMYNGWIFTRYLLLLFGELVYAVIELMVNDYDFRFFVDLLVVFVHTC